MPVQQIGQTRQRLADLVEGTTADGDIPGALSIALGRVALGHVRPAESAEFFATLQSGGPYLLIGADELGFSAGTAFGPVFIRATLYVGFDAAQAEPFTQVNDLLHHLRAIWMSGTYASNQLPPNSVAWQQWHVDSMNKPGAIAVPIAISLPAPDTET